MIRRPPRSTLFPSTTRFRSAGRAAKEAMLFSEVSEGFNAYGVGHHRHMAELDQEFSSAAGKDVVVSFTDRKSTRLNSSHANISYAVFCLKKKISETPKLHTS